MNFDLVNCPYCARQQDVKGIWNAECVYESDSEKIVCSECKKTFLVTVENLSVEMSVQKIEQDE